MLAFIDFIITLLKYTLRAASWKFLKMWCFNGKCCFCRSYIFHRKQFWQCFSAFRQKQCTVILTDVEMSLPLKSAQLGLGTQHMKELEHGV